MRRILGRPPTHTGLPEPTLESEPRRIACRPALFNSNHLTRVTACGFRKTLPELTDVLTASTYVEAPLATYAMGESTVLGGVIFTRKGRLILSRQVVCSLQDTLGDAPVEDEAVLINTMQGLRYFGHWLSDDVSAHEAYRDDDRVRSLPLPAWPDVNPYLDLFGQTWAQQMVMRARSLCIVRDLGFSERKAYRYRALRRRLRDRIGTAGGAGKVVFLKRGPSGDPREIANGAELEQKLSAAGVSIVRAEGGKDFIRALLDAAVIITIEGSQDRHALYALRDGGGMVTLAPPNRFYVATHEWARNLDMHSGIVIGTVAEGGFTIDPDEVLAMVDRLLARVENREAV